MVNGPPGTSTSAAAGPRRRPAAAAARAAPASPCAELVGGQHRLVVLLLVLGDHAEHEAVLEQPPAVQRRAVEHVEHLVADLADVGARLGRAEQRQRRPVGAGCWNAS